MRVDELPLGRGSGELAAQPLHVDVNRTVAVAQRPAPCLVGKLRTTEYRARMARQRDQQPEFVARQVQRLLPDHRDVLNRPDLERACKESFRECGFHQGTSILIRRPGGVTGRSTTCEDLENGLSSGRPGHYP